MTNPAMNAGPPSATGASSQAYPSAGQMPAGSIIVVDDQPANLRAVSALLMGQGYEVHTAGTGEEALALSARQVPDLWLLDMMMPGMDGFELLAQLKMHPELHKVPAIFLTAAQDRELLLRAFDAGAVDYVTKPFIPEELLARVAAHLGLKLTRDRFERVARQRQELVNLVAHDLKNPLSSVLFASDVLRNGGCKPERIPRYLEMIHESAADALGYIRRYLETQAKQATCRDITVSAPLDETLEWVVQRYELQLESRGMRLQVVTPPTQCHVAIDGLVLRQVVENLVSNAMKYAPGSKVDLSIRNSAPGFWQLLVEDRGPGVSSARQHQLFRPFTRLSDVATADDGLSSGLGLSLAKDILSDYDGNLWYEDREGGGARFVVELPVSAES
ncbi:MAG: hybrid sensor histidine kinase/response regulator [Luteimonas sp.]